jgi:hypothetical protein
MNTSTKKGLAIAWLVVAGLFGGVACLQLACIFTGVYDPVTADGVAPERVPFIRAWLLFVIVASLISGLVAFRYVRRHTNAA